MKSATKNLILHVTGHGYILILSLTVQELLRCQALLARIIIRWHGDAACQGIHSYYECLGKLRHHANSASHLAVALSKSESHGKGAFRRACKRSRTDKFPWYRGSRDVHVLSRRETFPSRADPAGKGFTQWKGLVWKCCARAVMMTVMSSSDLFQFHRSFQFWPNN